MHGEASISVLNAHLGKVTVDPLRVRGEGGAVSPALVIPVWIELLSRSNDSGVVVTWLEATLWVENARFDGPSLHHLLAGMRHPPRTSATGTLRDELELRFALSQPLIRRLERQAHRQIPVDVELDLRFEVALAQVVHSVDQRDGLGLRMELRPLWQSRIDDLTVRVPREHWAEKVLPGLGANELRLVAVRLPQLGNGMLGDEVVRSWDEARQQYDAGRYRAAIERCRDVRHLVEQALAATQEEPVARKLARRRELPEEHPTVRFVDTAWRALANITNDAHHLQGRTGLAAGEARVVLLLTAELIELLADAFEYPI